MKDKNTIGIIGQGFVGSAIREGMNHVFNVETFDIDPKKNTTCSSIQQLVDKVDEVVFVCLPTPMKKNGRCDTRIVEDAISEINDANKRLNKNVIAVIKSTVEPGTTDRLNQKYSSVDVIFNPEFLTEVNSFNDFKNQNRIIIGGPRPASTTVKTMYRKAFPTVPIIKTGADVAETVKYFINCYLATKVSFANEMKQVCDKLNIDYDKVVEYALYDQRIGTSHLSVPGPDGSLGFGGHCVKGDVTIKTSLGELKISKLNDLFLENPKNVKNNITVQSMNHNASMVDNKNVLKVVKNKYSGKMVKITFGEKQFECTSEHLLPVLRNGEKILIKAINLEFGDKVYVLNKTIETLKVKDVELYNFEGDVFNLELSSNDVHDDLFWVNGQTGIVTHNCFPKDLNAIRFVAKDLGINPAVLTAAWEKNLEVRPQAERDWENMVGRAVVED